MQPTIVEVSANHVLPILARTLALVVVCVACASGTPPRSAAPSAQPVVISASQSTKEPPAPQVSGASADDGAPPPELEGKPGWLGVQLQAVPPERPGVLIQQVTRGSPAEAAGLLAGDVLLQVNGELVNDWRAVTEKVSGTGAGRRALLVVDRRGQRRLFAVKLGLAPNREQLVRMHLGGRSAPRFGPLHPVHGSFVPTPTAMRGKVVVVDFWAAWCMPCRAVVPVLNDWYARYNAQGLEVVSVTTDPVVTAAQDVRELGVTYPVFSDEEAQTSRAFLATTLPTLVLVDRNGVVRHAIVGVSEERFVETEEKIVRLLAEAGTAAP